VGPLELVRLCRPMQCSQGRREIVIALIDGPVLLTHPNLASHTSGKYLESAKGAVHSPTAEEPCPCESATLLS
jgi:hypothetical protein